MPLEPNLDTKASSTQGAANYLGKFINYYQAQGWEYLRVEVISVFVCGENGCFGLGATPGHITNK